MVEDFRDPNDLCRLHGDSPDPNWSEHKGPITHKYKCPRCGTTSTSPAGKNPRCPKCGTLMR